MKQKTALTILIAAAAVALAIWFGRALFVRQPSASSDEATPTSQDAANDIASIQSAPQASRYVHHDPDFSFDKPDGYTVGAIPDSEGGQTLVVQRDSAAGSAAKDGFQIVITPLDAPMELTAAYIKQQIPDIAITTGKTFVLDGKAKGIMFESNSSAFGGKSFEIWFINPDPSGVGAAGYLYQVTSYASFSAQLQQIIGTWKF